MNRTFYVVSARITVIAHFLWTFLLFAGGLLVIFYHPYAWYQIGIMSFTILFWFPFGFKCALTVWARYFEEKAGVWDGDDRTFMVKYLSKLFKRDLSRKKIAAFITFCFITSYFISIGALVGWF